MTILSILFFNQYTVNTTISSDGRGSVQLLSLVCTDAVWD